MSGFNILGDLLGGAASDLVDETASGIKDFYVLFFIAVIALLIWVSLPGEHRHLRITKTDSDVVEVMVDEVPLNNWNNNTVIMDVKEGQKIIITYNGHDWEFIPAGYYYKNIEVTINGSSITRELK